MDFELPPISPLAETSKKSLSHSEQGRAAPAIIKVNGAQNEDDDEVTQGKHVTPNSASLWQESKGPPQQDFSFNKPRGGGYDKYD